MTAVTPRAEVPIDAALVRALVAAQHPDLAHLEVTKLAEGWDNASWRLGPDLVVRLPRRAVAVALAANEHRWLGHLAPRLPLPVPAPVRLGVATDAYPWPWSIVPWIDGEPGDRAPVTDPDTTARRLGGLLRALHRPAPDDAPHNAVRGGPLSGRADAFTERLGGLVTGIDVDLADAVAAAFADGCEAPAWAGGPRWLHGDLHPANVLVAHGALAAVIDFGDVCGGDPATDLAAAWMLLPTAWHGAVLDAYGGADDALVRRARGWAAHFGTMLLAIGLDPGPDAKPTYEAIGRATLARVTGTAEPDAATTGG